MMGGSSQCCPKGLIKGFGYCKTATDAPCVVPSKLSKPDLEATVQHAWTLKEKKVSMVREHFLPPDVLAAFEAAVASALARRVASSCVPFGGITLTYTNAYHSPLLKLTWLHLQERASCFLERVVPVCLDPPSSFTHFPELRSACVHTPAAAESDHLRGVYQHLIWLKWHLIDVALGVAGCHRVFFFDADVLLARNPWPPLVRASSQGAHSPAPWSSSAASLRNGSVLEARELTPTRRSIRAHAGSAFAAAARLAVPTGAADVMYQPNNYVGHPGRPTGPRPRLCGGGGREITSADGRTLPATLNGGQLLLQSRRYVRAVLAAEPRSLRMFTKLDQDYANAVLRDRAANFSGCLLPDTFTENCWCRAVGNPSAPPDTVCTIDFCSMVTFHGTCLSTFQQKHAAAEKALQRFLACRH